MRILVDADACPVKQIIVKAAKEYGVPVLMFIDTSHVLNDGYSQVITVDKSADSVDIALANKASGSDIVVTQDYGVAALVLPKCAGVLNQNGLVYTNDNIDRLLFERHLGLKVRRAGGRIGGPRKRSGEDDERFEKAFRAILEKSVNPKQIWRKK
ncbi:MAG: YaiI/YqxD family protein [Ruminiclostridium sp.]|nr:YaiI/YqxD family protein [Ruminiclostridium sp.]